MRSSSSMLMLRCALNEEYLKLHLQLLKWEGSCRPFVVAFSDWQNKITLDDPNDIHQINQAFLQILSLFINSFDGMLDKLKEFPLKDEMEVPEVNECPIEGMEERLKRRLQKPLKIAKLNCKKLEDKINHSGLEENKNYLASLSSKIRSIAKGIEKEFITFISEVELELIIKKFKWPSDSRLVTIILNAKLGILENELSAKIVAFEEQEPQDVDGFMEFSEYFKLEWNKIEQKTEQLKRNNAEKKEDYSKRGCLFNPVPDPKKRSGTGSGSGSPGLATSGSGSGTTPFFGLGVGVRGSGSGSNPSLNGISSEEQNYTDDEMVVDVTDEVEK
uniref:Uncharacterized protein n=1 Tax=Globodera pallida TaxID=36090 RepID=A0A183CHJ1_GLOPA